jgi:hypothetical protein
MALQPRFGQGLSEKFLPLYFIERSSTSHAIAVYAIRSLIIWSSRALNRDLCGRFLAVAHSIALLDATPMTFGLLNSLLSSKLFLLLYPPSTFLGPYIVRRTFLKDEQSVLFPFYQHPRLTAVQHDQAVYDVPVI